MGLGLGVRVRVRVRVWVRVTLEVSGEEGVRADGEETLRSGVVGRQEADRPDAGAVAVGLALGRLLEDLDVL